MNQFPTPALAAEPPKGTAKDAFDRLTFLGWRWGLAAITAGLAVSFFLFGYALIYWRNADMDFMVIYNALVLNDGKPQLFFDHTAYITILSVKLWYQLLHALGLLDAWSLSAIPAASDVPAFDAAMTHAVRAGRLLAFLIATGCVLVFAGLVRLIVRDWRVAMLATLAFAFSGGIAVHSRILRSELVAACPVIFALMILIVVGRRASIARPLGMAAAAGLCVLGLENKVQAILLIGALPLLVLPFGSAASSSVAFWRNTRSSWLAAGLAAVAAAGRGMGGMAADCHRLRPRPAGRRAVPSAVAGPLRHLSGGAAGAGRRLHDRLCGDLARQRGRDARIDVCDCRRRFGDAARTQPRIQCQQRDCGVQSAGKNADLCRCDHHRMSRTARTWRQFCCCCSRGSHRFWRATPSCCTPRRARRCS